jgi:putative peptide zinc metalloprotease protein
MMPSSATTELRGRNQVRLRLRPNLELSARSEGGQTVHVLKDPVSLRYFRLDERQLFLARLMDGAHSLEEIRDAYERCFRPDRLPAEELEAFAAQLANAGLIVNDSPLAGRLLLARADKERGQALRERLLNILCLRVPLLDPDRLLGRLLPLARPLFSRGAVLLAAALVLTAVGLVATHWQGFLDRLPGYREMLSPKSLLYFWLALGLVKILHELGHGLCCKKFGGEVHEMGLLLLLFFPCLYCDVSDAWKLPGKGRRLAISAAGIYVELLIAALATFAWWLSDAGTFVHHLSFGLMLVCSVNTVVCNANPLMRLDGYYLLADALGVPNLAELSGHTFRAGLQRWLGQDAPPPLPMTARRQTLLASYAAASLLYRCVVLAATLYLLHGVLQPYKLAAVCYGLAAAAVISLFVRPVVGLAQAIRRHGGLATLRPRRVGLTVALPVAVVVVVGFVPLPLKVEGTALVVVEPDRQERVTVPECGGFLTELRVRDGQQVREGEVLAILTNPKLEIALRLNEADQALRLEQQRAEVAHLTETAARDRETDGGLGAVEFEVQSLRQQHALLRRQREQLTLRAPRDGVLLGLPSREEVGKWLERGTELCRVGDGRALRAVLLVEPSDHPWVVPGSAARFRVHGGGARCWTGEVRDIAQVEARAIPAPLSHHAGGEVATEQEAATRQETPRSPHYLVSVSLGRADRMIHPGALGRVQMRAGSQTLWWRLQRYLATTFNWGL